MSYEEYTRAPGQQRALSALIIVSVCAVLMEMGPCVPSFACKIFLARKPPMLKRYLQRAAACRINVIEESQSGEVYKIDVNNQSVRAAQNRSMALLICYSHRQLRGVTLEAR